MWGVLESRVAPDTVGRPYAVGGGGHDVGKCQSRTGGQRNDGEGFEALAMRPDAAMSVVKSGRCLRRLRADNADAVGGDNGLASSTAANWPLDDVDEEELEEYK